MPLRLRIWPLHPKSLASSGRISTSVARPAWARIRRRACLNRFNQVHDAKNVFITDGACFVTQGCYEPTLTIMAISLRATEYIVAGTEKGEPVMDPEELTRRRSLLRLGSGAALAGWSGIDLSAAEWSQLPPGLYEPSINHLAHVLKPVPANGSAPAPQFFNDQEYANVTELVGLILGEEPQKASVP